MLRKLRLPIALCAVALSSVPAFAGASASAAAPVAQAAASCTASTSTLAGGYYIPGTHRHVSCATRRRLEAGFQSCRLAHGQKGHCYSKIRGFTCKEAKRNVIPTQFFTTVTCTKGSAMFAYVYYQDTL